MAAKCNECGKSVKRGSGRFVNRVPDLNTQEVRKEMGKPYPEGDYVCAECDGVIECEHCGASYTEQDFEKLELTGHNIIWNFDYRRCSVCGEEIGEITGYSR